MLLSSGKVVARFGVAECYYVHAWSLRMLSLLSFSSHPRNLTVEFKQVAPYVFSQNLALALSLEAVMWC